MANFCSACGMKIGFTNGYMTLSESGELVCSQCAGLLSHFNDKLWSCTDEEEAKKIKEDAALYVKERLSYLHNPNNLILYFNDKFSERLKYLTPIDSSDNASSTILAAPEPEPVDIYTELCEKLILSTASSLEGYRITKQLGVVFGETVFKPSAGQQITSAVGDMFRAFSFSSKEMTGQVGIIEEARKFAYIKMMKAAINRGANAIIAIDSDNTIGDSICYLSLYGTAVCAEPVEN